MASPSGFRSGHTLGGQRLRSELAQRWQPLSGNFTTCPLVFVCPPGGAGCLDAGVGPDVRLCPQNLAQRGCSGNVLGKERVGEKKGAGVGGEEERREGERDYGRSCMKAGQCVEPSGRSGKGAACSAVGGCEETLHLKQAIHTPASSSGPPRSLGKGVSHRHGPSFVTA